MSQLLGLNSFVLRQTAASPYSHFAGTSDELLTRVEAHWPDRAAGYRPGVWLVPVPAEGFFSAVVDLNVDPTAELVASFEARREGEAKYVTVRARGHKLPAAVVEVVVYAREVLLEEGNDAAETGLPFELISINARPTPGPEPMTPMAMARNFLALPGGSKADYTAEQFAAAILYWSSRAMAAPIL